VSRRATTGASFKYLGDKLLEDLMDYCACNNDTSLTFVIKKAVKAYLKAELGDKEKERAFYKVRNERLEIASQDNVTPIRPGAKNRPP
jgi:hypothetical protein